MQEVKLKITGTSPLLMNNPASMKSGGGGLSTKKKEYIPEEEAAPKRYLTSDGEHLCFPVAGFLGGIIQKACSGRKINKRFASAVVPGALFQLNELTVLLDPITNKPISADDYDIDVRRAVVGKAGVHRARPKVENWATELTLEFDDEFLDPQTILELVNLAGKIAGVGDFRPAKRGPFGRYSAELI